MRDVLTPLFFFYRRALLALSLPIALAVVAMIFAPKIYVADSKILILLGEQYALHGALSGPQPNLSFDRAQMVKAETEIIGSQELSRQTVQEIGARNLYPNQALDLETAAEKLRHDISIEGVAQSNVVDISLRNSDPQIAARALNTLIQIYLRRRNSVFEQGNLVSLESQTNAIAMQLASAEDALSSFSATYHIADYQLELSGETNLQMQLRAQMANLSREMADARGRHVALEQQKARTPERTQLTADFTRPLALEALEQSLASLQTQRRDAEQVYVAGSPMIRDLDERISKIQQRFAGTQKQQQSGAHEGLNPVWQNAVLRLDVSRSDLAGLVEAKEATQSALNQVDQRLQELIKIGPRYRSLVQSRDLLETTRNDLVKRAQQARLEAVLSNSQENVRIFQSARPPLHDISQRWLLLLIGVGAGIGAMAGTVLASAAAFPGLLTPRDAELRLGTAVIVTLNEQTSRPRRPPLPGAPQATLLLLGDAEVIDHFITQQEPSEHPVVQWIGADVGVGVTTLLVDYALFAAADRKTLIIDAAAGFGPSAVDQLRLRGAELDALGDEERIARVRDSNLFVTRLSNDGVMVMKDDELRRSLNRMTEQFDLVLVDSPPISLSPAGLRIAHSADVTLAVIRAETTRTAVARHMIDRVVAAGGVVSGSIFNGRRFYIPERLYAAV